MKFIYTPLCPVVGTNCFGHGQLHGKTADTNGLPVYHISINPKKTCYAKWNSKNGVFYFQAPSSGNYTFDTEDKQMPPISCGDLMTSFQLDSCHLHINISNMLDEKYAQSGSDSSDVHRTARNYLFTPAYGLKKQSL